MVLAEGGFTRVVRVGGTVRRPARPFTATVQAYLQHLRAVGVDFVPEPLGYDEQGREVLSFVEGDVPLEPVPAWAVTDEALVALAELIRRLHDAAAEWVPPADAVWGSIPGTDRVGVPALFEAPELVSHMDYCPGNVVFREGRPAAFIDFDLARPTTRVVDCVNALRWWAPLEAPGDRAQAFDGVDVVRRVRVFADAYGMDEGQRRQVVPVALQGARNSIVRMAAAAEADPLFKRWWDEGLRERLPRAAQWLAAESGRLTAALLAPPTSGVVEM